MACWHSWNMWEATILFSFTWFYFLSFSLYCRLTSPLNLLEHKRKPFHTLPVTLSWEIARYKEPEGHEDKQYTRQLSLYCSFFLSWNILYPRFSYHRSPRVPRRHKTDFFCCTLRCLGMYWRKEEFPLERIIAISFWNNHKPTVPAIYVGNPWTKDGKVVTNRPKIEQVLRLFGL